MSKRIENKLIKAGVNLDGVTINHNEIEICIGYKEENGFGSCDEKAVKAKHKEIIKVVDGFAAGYYTQYGALVLPKGYQVNEFDYMDKENPCHY